MARYQVHHFLFLDEKKGVSLGKALSAITGNKMMAIQRISYRTPIKKEGTTSPNESPLGRKARKVASLNSVKISKKITSRLATHNIVFGILYLTSIPLIDCKRIEFTAFQQTYMIH